MFLNSQEFARELAEYVFKPSRIAKLSKTYDIDMYDYFE
jgi:hypothetical protein